MVLLLLCKHQKKGEKGRLEVDAKMRYDPTTGRLDVPVLGGVKFDGDVDVKGHLLRNAHISGGSHP